MLHALFLLGLVAEGMTGALARDGDGWICLAW